VPGADARALHSLHKIIITGTGRAGTTFLVRLLTELGQPTGYTRDNWQEDYFSHCAAGLEHDIADPESPYIVKNPELCSTLSAILARGDIVIDHAIVPLRELEAAALSRIRIGGANGEVPGGLVGTSDPERQKAILAERFHELVHTLVAHEIPHTFLLFPRFVQDADYAFEHLRPLLSGIDPGQFRAAFARTADPSLVHTFRAGQTVPVGDAREFRLTQRRKRVRRRTRRLALWSTIVAGLVAVIGARWPAGTNKIQTPGHPGAQLPKNFSAGDWGAVPRPASAMPSPPLPAAGPAEAPVFLRKAAPFGSTPVSAGSHVNATP
jgi:hypothetical protein